MFLKFARWIHQNIADICMVIGVFGAVDVLFSWTVGYWLEGLYGIKFPIDSCWQGLTAMGAGLVGLFTHLINSALNSPRGVFPDIKQQNGGNHK